MYRLIEGLYGALTYIFPHVLARESMLAAASSDFLCCVKKSRC
jgi:hypothetical protein